MLELVYSASTGGALRCAASGSVGFGRGKVRAAGSSPESGNSPAAGLAGGRRKVLPADAKSSIGEAAVLELALDMGPLAEDGNLSRRRELLGQLYGTFFSDAYPHWERTLEALERLRRVGAGGEPVRIWLCPDTPSEVCGLFYTCHLLKNSCPPLFVVSLPRTPHPREDGAVCRFRGSGEYSPEELAQAAENTIPLSPALGRYCVTRWNDLVRENAPLRVLLNGDLLSVPEDFYDSVLRDSLPRGSFRVGNILGRLLSRLSGVGDGWLFLRLQAMVRSGELVEVAPPGEEHPYSGWLRGAGLPPESPEERAEREAAQRPPERRTVYLDAGSLDGGTVPIFSSSVEVIFAGTTCCLSPIQDRDSDNYRSIAASGDVAFLFEGDEVHPDFYAVPRLDLFAVTADGGWLGTLGGLAGDRDLPICYVNSSNKVFQAAGDLESFLDLLKSGRDWRSRLTPCRELRLYPSQEAAAQELPFVKL